MMKIIGYHKFSLPGDSYLDPDFKNRFENLAVRQKRKKNYQQLIIFIKKALKSLNINSIQIIPRFNFYVKSSNKNSGFSRRARKYNPGVLYVPYVKGIEIKFTNLDLSIIYTSKRYSFNVLKEDILIAFMLYKCNYNLKSLFNLTNENKDIYFHHHLTLVAASNIYLKYKQEKSKVNDFSTL